MDVLSFSVGQLQTNCYLLINNNQCLIIDPGDGADFILEEIQRRNLVLCALVATHGHFDHILATGEIQSSYPVPLYISKSDLFLVKRLNDTAEYFLGFNPQAIPPQPMNWLKEGLLIIHEFSLRVISTPGHTPGSCSFYFPIENIIFTGDTLFKQAIGRYDFSYSDVTKLRLSLQTLFSLPEHTKVYSGHGVVTTIDAENKRKLL